MDLIVFIRVNSYARKEILWALGFIERNQQQKDKMVVDDDIPIYQIGGNKQDFSRECARDKVPCKSFECWQTVHPHSVVCKMDCDCYKCAYGACPPALKNKE